MAFTKGKSGNPNGKPKGAVTQTTAKAKELILAAIDEQSQYFGKTMDLIRKKNPIEWAKIQVKLMDFVLPKKIDVTSEGKGLSMPVVNWASKKDGSSS